MKINKLYQYDELDNLINHIIPKTKLPITGIVFYPMYSGLFYIFNNKNHQIKKRQEIKNVNNSPKVNTKTYPKFTPPKLSPKSKPVSEKEKPKMKFRFTDNNHNDDSYHLVSDLKSYLIDRTMTSKNDFTECYQRELTLKKSDIPDVYYVFDDKEKKGIAHIPNLKLSHTLDKIFENINSKTFLCYYDNVFKKWCPLLD